ncbi:small secreted protein [Streptomyces radicis]|uniref:small secreted protein n=1 Tax=Streptomyces radicis TaxID=1750517 RepID=UPI0011C48E35|nr:small secreted protein [Streptomyces radicis]
MTLSGCAALLLTLSACGGGDDDERADEWARQVCDELRPQVERINGAYASIAQVGEQDREPQEVQETNSAAYQEISDAYAALAETVEQAGDPPVDNGEQIREDTVSELNDLSAAFTGLKEEMDALDTSDRGAFAEGLRDILPRLDEVGRSGTEALEELERGEMSEAFARQEGCQSPPAEPPAEDGGASAGEGAEESPAEESPAEESPGEGETGGEGESADE